MMHAAQNFELGTGLFSLAEVSQLLRIDQRRIRAWWKRYWEHSKVEAGDSVDFSNQLSFANLVEAYVLNELVSAGVRPGRVVRAYQCLVEEWGMSQPFSREDVLKSIKTDGEKVYLKWEDTIISLDGSTQINLAIIHEFIYSLDFSDNSVVRFWPTRRTGEIVVDPQIQFGRPTVHGNRIEPVYLFQHFLAGESVRKIAFLYDLEETQVEQAVKFCQAA